VAGRKVVDEAEARAILTRIARSRSDVRTWARANGLDGRSLNAWRNIVARKNRTPAPAKPRRRRREKSIQLVELVPREVVVSPTLARYAMRIGDAVVEFGDDARADTLRRVLEALRSC